MKFLDLEENNHERTMTFGQEEFFTFKNTINQNLALPKEGIQEKPKKQCSSPLFRFAEEKKCDFDNMVAASIMGFQEEKSLVIKTKKNNFIL